MDAIVHLAGVSNDPIGNTFEDVTLAINHRATVELAGRAKAAGVGAFVFASSCSIYGQADDAPRVEESELGPLTAYARSKALAERDLAPLADDRFRVTCLRFATACGMSDRLRLDLVLNDFVASAIATGRIDIMSDGTPWRPLIHVADMARAIDWAIDRPGQEDGPTPSSSPTSAAMPGTSRCGSSRTRSPGRSPACRSRSTPTRSPTSGRIA